MAILVAAGFVIGIGAALLIAGTWILAFTLSRIFPQLGTPTSWAVAIICEMTITLFLSAIAAIISGHAHGPATNLGILSAPIAVGVGLSLIAARQHRPAAGMQYFFDRIAIIVTGVVVVAYAALNARGPSYGIAWAMSGDARNHLLIMRTAIYNGGITVDQLRSYPVGFNAIAALVAGSTPRSHLSSGQLMVHDIHALVAVYLVLIIAVGCMVIAILAGFISHQALLPTRSAMTSTIVFLIAALVAVCPLVLGTSLNDGFFSAYGALALSLASIAIGLRTLTSEIRSPIAYVFLAPAMLLLFISWTILAVVPAALAIFIAVVYFVRFIHEHPNRILNTRIFLERVLYALPILSTLVIIVVTTQNLTQLKTSFVQSGSITAPSLWTLPIITLILICFGLVSSAGFRAFAFALLFTVILSAAIVLWLSHVPRGWHALEWTYYSQKTLWLIICSMIWVPFVALIKFLEKITVSAKPDQRTARKYAALFLATATLLPSLSLATTAAEPIYKAYAGWQQPAAPVINEVISEADDNQSFVLWDFSNPGDDRLGNFWASFAWTTTTSGVYKRDPAALPGGFAYWAYFYTEQIQDLCKVVDAYPKITVVTRSRETRIELRRSCGMAHYTVDIVN